MKKILIVTNSYDLHVDLIVPILTELGHAPFRLNLDQFPKHYTLSQQFINATLSGTLTNTDTDDTIDIDQISAVWMRKPADYSYLSAELSKQELAFAKDETTHALFSFIYCLDCYWIGHPLAMRGSMWKGEQLKRAQQIGFLVPDTLITNSPNLVSHFIQLANADEQPNATSGLIYKTMSSPDLASERVSEDDVIATGLDTTLITNEMHEYLDAVALIPCQFQQYIDKQYELRITVIGDTVFAARINSQEDSRTQIDSRDMSAEISYSAYQLPNEIRERCLQFVRSYDLNFAAIDMIVTPNGDYIFLENNPNGQFLYVEQLVPEFNMLHTMALTLIKGSQCHS